MSTNNNVLGVYQRGEIGQEIIFMSMDWTHKGNTKGLSALHVNTQSLLKNGLKTMDTYRKRRLVGQ
jgi:hypothetical protein